MSENEAQNNRIPAKKFLEGDLLPIGIYGFDILRMEVKERKGENGPFKVLQGRFEIHTVVKDVEGNVDLTLTKPFRVTDSFRLEGRSVGKLKSLYRTITGESVPVIIGEDGEPYIDLDAVCDDLRGARAFGSYTHSVNDSTQEIFGGFGFSFAKKASDVYPPKELQ